MKLWRSLVTRLVVSLTAAVAIVGCSGSSPGDDAGKLDRIKDAGVLTVATRNAPTTYYLGREAQPRGPEYDMATDFARSLGVQARFVVKNSVSEMLAAVANGAADLAAGGLTKTAARNERFDFGPAYQQVKQQVVCRSKGKKARKISQLKDVDLVVIGKSSYVERLRALKAEHPDLRWRTNDELGTEQLLGRVWKKKIDCTVADSNIVDINRRYYPELLVMFDLTGPQELAWVMPKHSDALRSAAESWFAAYRKSGKLAQMKDAYYGFITAFDFLDKKKLSERIDRRYVKYDHLFEKAAERHDVPVDLLSAQAYQESHWNPKATSPTGVRGMMMLTKRTARELGVDNRLDPAQSIAGGARYLDNMQERLNDEIPEPDRTYLALAAYNVGLAHLRDAQRLAERMGKNPYDWTDLKQVLPLLADKRYYPSLKYGYARGTEPVRYVKRIRDYEDVIAKHME